MILNKQFKVAGRYRLHVRDVEGGPVLKDTGWIDNLILDQGLDQIGSVPNSGVPFGEPILWAVGCVGTGTTAPMPADTQLEAWVASAGNYSGYSVSWVAGGTPYWKCIHTYRFGTGVAAGNLTEVGVGITNYDGTGLFSRALIVDGGGSPTTLVVTSTEILDLTYEFRVYPDTTETVQVLTINSVDYTFTWNLYRPTTVPNIYRAYINSSGTFSSCRIIYSQTTTFSGGASAVNPTSISYSSGTYYRTYTGILGTSAFYWGATAGSIAIETNHMRWGASISPALPKSGTESISTTFNISWARFTP